MAIIILSVLIIAMACTISAIPLPPPSPSNSDNDSFQDFFDIHIAPSSSTPPPNQSIGFHIQLGHEAIIPSNRDIQLGNFFQLKSGLFAVGPAVFEAFNGSFCSPVNGYYYLSAIVHLTSSLDQPVNGSDGDSTKITVSLCLKGHCNDQSTVSLETVSTTSGLQTLSVSGLLSLNKNDEIVLHVKTNNVTMATVLRDSSFMAFLWGQSL